jgi:hypothetical protein
MTTRARLPKLGAFATARLFVSYQRYGALLLVAPIAVVIAVARIAPWWAALLVGLAGIAPVRFGVEVVARWPRKLRATRIAVARIAAGSFSAASVRPYCGDPCFRVVATEILARAGMARHERKTLVRSFQEQLRQENSVRVLVDHVRGTVLTFGGENQERTGT